MPISKRFFGKSKMGKSADATAAADRSEHTTLSTASTASDTTEPMEVPIHMHFNILSEKNLSKAWKDLKSGTIYSALKSVRFSFYADPNKDITKMKHLGDVFGALGSLPHLEELVFCNATLVLPSVYKLLKKSSLRTLKFHHCKFVLSSKNRKDKEPIEKLWEGVQLQTRLEVLEILACKTWNGDEDSAFSYEMPAFLQEQQLPNLRRLVLDECILDASKQTSFITLLNHKSSSLQELEIHPVFETATGRRQQYQAKKRAVRTFLLETIPNTLASNRTLQKLVVSIPDYHLDAVYLDAMAHWADLVQDHNHTLTDLRATPHPLASTNSTKEADNAYGMATDAWLHCNLQYYLRLNELMAQGQVSKQDVLNKEEFMAEILPADVACLHHLLQPNPDIMDASTHSVPCFDKDKLPPAAVAGSGRRGSCVL